MRIRAVVATAAGLGMVLALAGCGGSSDHSGTGHSDAGHSGSAGTGSADASAVATASPGATTAAPGDVHAGNAGDIAFAQLMIPHHQQAIEMADLALADDAGASQDVRDLAGRIMAAQDPEIALMTDWLTAWGAPTRMPGGDASDSDHAGHDMGGMAMSGIMSEEDMAALAEADGRAFDRLWLEMMIVHHQGAVEMSQQVLQSTANPDVAALAEAIIAGQTAEIETMRGLLAR